MRFQAAVSCATTRTSTGEIADGDVARVRRNVEQAGVGPAVDDDRLAVLLAGADDAQAEVAVVELQRAGVHAGENADGRDAAAGAIAAASN